MVARRAYCAERGLGFARLEAGDRFEPRTGSQACGIERGRRSRSVGVDATDRELVALLEDDTGMELLVCNKIISLDLNVKDVYKKIWVPEHGEVSERNPLILPKLKDINLQS